jgi:predicted ArsR family transcriptional regulator
MATLQEQARALGNRTRHEIFRYLADSASPLGIAELTAQFGLSHNAIRQHVAKLLDAGLVTRSRAPSRGIGRPRLAFQVAPDVGSRWGVTGPYERLSHLLAEMVRTGDSAVEVGRRAGYRRGGTHGPGCDPVADLAAAMARDGFDPQVSEDDGSVEIVLRTCPFESTALADPDTVCALHLGIAEGLAAAGDRVAVDELVTRDPRQAGCRLRLRLEGATP